jgi:uncharacterized protein (DUF58 family)
MGLFSSRPAAERERPSDDDAGLFDPAFQRRLESLALLARKVAPGRDRAERRTRRAGHGVELADYRSYAPGDDYRSIDWNAYARTERLMLRLFEQEEDLAVYLLLDCSGSMGAGARDGAAGQLSKLGYGKRLVAALAYVALTGLDRVSVHALAADKTARLAPARGKARIFAVLELLRGVRAEGGTNLASSVARFVAQHRRRGLAILISDLYDPKGFEEAVSKLRYARFETHVIHIVDQREQHPPLRGDVELVDAETGALRRVTITPALLARYEAAYKAHRARVVAFCRDKQVPLHVVELGEPLEDAIGRMLRRGGLLAP